MNSPERYTSTYELNLFSFNDFLQAEFPDIEYILKNGLVIETSYKKAYSITGEYERYKKHMAILGIENSRIYQVTPKGNGLIFLIPDGGDKQKTKNKITKLKPAFNN